MICLGGVHKICVRIVCSNNIMLYFLKNECSLEK